MECIGDRQEYHTDGTLHMIWSVQGTDRNITLTEHYLWYGVYRGQTGISHWRNITYDMECTGDRQEYHTDGSLHMIWNVQGTNRNITLTEHYICYITSEKNVQGTDITNERNVKEQTLQAQTVYCTSVHKTSLLYRCFIKPVYILVYTINSIERLTFKRWKVNFNSG